MPRSAPVDERWIDGTEIVPTEAEVLAFGRRLAADGPHLLWTGPVDDRGQGVAPFRGGTMAAHRVAFALVHGMVPARRWKVVEDCGEPLCCAPGCLRLSPPGRKPLRTRARRRADVGARGQTGGPNGGGDGPART